MTTLGQPAPPKPAAFHSNGAPDGVEVRYPYGRPKLAQPLRSAFVHTNGASGEGSIESAWNWALAKPNSNTCPHYQVDRSGRARKMVPSDGRAIGNGTVGPDNPAWSSLTAGQRAEILEHGFLSNWSLVIETADLGFPTPGEACGFTDDQGETVAAILAYESIVSPALPLVQLPAWWGAGVAAHTDPFTYPFTTTSRGKVCPGRQKKLEVRDWILPRSFEIRAAWIGSPVVIPPTPADGGTYPPGSRNVMYPIDYGIAGTDSWWTEMAITPKGLQWSGGPSSESQEIRKIFVAVPMPRAPRLRDDADVINLMATIGTFGDCPSTFLQNPGLRDAWAANLNPGR